MRILNTVFSLVIFLATAQVFAQSRPIASQATRFETTTLNSTEKLKSFGQTKKNFPTFHAHMTESAQTLRPGQFSYLRNSGLDPSAEVPFANSFEAGAFSFLTENSLSVGVFDWLTVGTNPIYWTVEGTVNGSFKLRIFRSKNVTLSFGYSHLSFSKLFSFRNDGFSLNILWQINSYLSLGHSSTISYLEGGFGAYRQWRNPSHFFDLEYWLNPSFSLTPSVSWSKGRSSSQLKPIVSDSQTFGLGSSVTWKTPKGWFVDPTIGAHFYPEYSGYQAMFSLYFH